MNIKNILDKYLKLRMVRFLLAGGLTFTVEYVIFLFIYYGLHSRIELANVVSFIAGLTASYFVNKFWVFANTNKVNSQAFIFASLAVVNLVVSTYLVAFLSEYMWGSIAKLIVVTAIVSWNYVLYKKIIFLSH